MGGSGHGKQAGRGIRCWHAFDSVGGAVVPWTHPRIGCLLQFHPPESAFDDQKAFAVDLGGERECRAATLVPLGLCLIRCQ